MGTLPPGRAGSTPGCSASDAGVMPGAGTLETGTMNSSGTVSITCSSSGRSVPKPSELTLTCARSWAPVTRE